MKLDKFLIQKKLKLKLKTLIIKIKILIIFHFFYRIIKTFLSFLISASFDSSKESIN